MDIVVDNKLNDSHWIPNKAVFHFVLMPLGKHESICSSHTAIGKYRAALVL